MRPRVLQRAMVSGLLCWLAAFMQVAAVAVSTAGVLEGGSVKPGTLSIAAPLRVGVASRRADGGDSSVSYTFDTDSMGWVGFDGYALLNTPVPWQDGRILIELTNRRHEFHDPSWIDWDDYATFLSPDLAQPLSGTEGTVSFDHELAGTMPSAEFSVCLQDHSSLKVPPADHRYPCSRWQPVTDRHVELRFQSEVFRQRCLVVVNMQPSDDCQLLSEEGMAEILNEVNSLWITYRGTDQCLWPETSCLENSNVFLDNVVVEVKGPTGRIRTDSPVAMLGTETLFWATVEGADGEPIKDSDEVTVTVDDGDPWSLSDDGYPDFHGGDGVYSANWSWEEAGGFWLTLYYQGKELDSTFVEVTSNPRLVVLTDLYALYDQFRDTGTAAGEDVDGDGEDDFYGLLSSVAEYTSDRQGIVYDININIHPSHGWSDVYALLDFGGTDRATNRFRMAKLVDEALTRLHRDASHTIADVAILGHDDVVPHYRIADRSGRTVAYDDPGIDSPTWLDMADGFILTDVPYGTVDYVNQDAVTRPTPEIAVGRVAAQTPYEMTRLLQGYTEPVTLGGETSAAVFYPADDETAWSWLGREVWTPVLAARYPLRDFRLPAPLPAGFYRLDGALLDWAPSSVSYSLDHNNLTVLATHGTGPCADTMSAEPVCAPDYGSLGKRAGLYVLAAGFGGLLPALYTPSGTQYYFYTGVPRWVQNSLRTLAGTTWYRLGLNCLNAYSDYLFSHFVSQALGGGSETIGDAWVRAWYGYWASPGAETAYATSAAYGMILWGLPTQPLELDGGASPAATVRAAPVAAARTGALAAPAARSVVLEIDEPRFTMEPDGSGALLIQPAGGGTTWAGGPDQPVLPRVVDRVELPPGATGIAVAEDAGARVARTVGRVTLRTAALNADCDGCALSVTAARAAAPYPSAPFSFDVRQGPDRTVVTVSAVPAQLDASGSLTLYERMKLTLAYTLPGAPAVSITGLALNSGRAVGAGQRSLPLALTLASAAAQQVAVSWSVSDAAGFAAGAGSARLDVPAGAGQAVLQLDGTRWEPGRKRLNVAVSAAGAVTDTATASFQVLPSVPLRRALRPSR